MNRLFDSFLVGPEVTDCLSDYAVVDAMLRFEAALARAQASAGVIPPGAAQSIISTCKVALFDVPKLAFESTRLRCPATPLLTSLRETVALFNKQAAPYVHFGCDAQDLVNSALALVTRPVLKLIEADLAHCTQALLALAKANADVAMLDRGPGPEGVATSFGLKCTQWAAPLVRVQLRLPDASAKALTLQTCQAMAADTAMQGKGADVLALVAAELQLGTTALAGGTPCDDWVALACELGLMVGSLGKLATGLAYLTEFEVGELTALATPMAGVPGAWLAVSPVSPAMLCQVAQSAALRVPHQVAVLMATLSQDDAYAHGLWQTQLAQWPGLLAACQGMVHTVLQLLSALQVDPKRMRLNLDAKRSSMPDAGSLDPITPQWLQQATRLTQSHIKALQPQSD
jgi:3-carboxy-cis,cis-muconate cycloisomerase